jgi:osmotically inducible protein OsmC
MLVEKVLYCAQVKATAGRDIRTVSSDGVLDLIVTRPRELGGTNGRGTTPEQLFAASYAAVDFSSLCPIRHQLMSILPCALRFT